MTQLEPRLLRRLLFEHLKPSNFEGENPYLVTENDTKYWVYLKNLSPAYFKNPDVWRAQLPVREVFNECKESPYPFILLGYDDDNDVYATWNPFFTKQRLNEAESVSFYSRLSLQQEASESQEVMSLVLQNDLKVICFPRSLAKDVISSINTYFSEDSNEYVAIGSKRRTDANASYRYFTDTQNIQYFFEYLIGKGYSDKTATNYSQAIKRFITKGVFSKYRTLFLKYDFVSDYHKAFTEFFAKDDVSKLNESSRKIHSNAFIQYLDFLCEINGLTTDAEKTSFSTNSIVQELQGEYSTIDWEAEFTDINGKLTKITNPKLLELLRPVLDTEYKKANTALNIIQDFYADKFQEVMELKDWMNLIREIEWDNRLPNKDNNSKVEATITSKSSGSKEYTMVVTLSDGTVLKSSNNTKTFMDVIEFFGADYIIEMDIQVNGRNLISKEFSHPRLKELPSGYYVDVNYKTDKKAEILKQIASEFDEDISVDLIPFNSAPSQKIISPEPASIPSSSVGSSERQKIKVIFEDGTEISHKIVVQTFIETLCHIGLDKIKPLELFIGPHALVVESETSPNGRKYFSSGNNWHIHVNTRTDKKYYLLKEIISRLGLDIKVFLLDGSATSPISQIQFDSVEYENTSTRDKIKVTFPNGRVICYNNVADTLIEVIKFAGVDNVEKLGLTAHNSKTGQLLIVREVNPKYEIATKPVSPTQYIFTNTQTSNKYATIQIINEKFSLGLKVELLVGVNRTKRRSSNSEIISFPEMID